MFINDGPLICCRKSGCCCWCCFSSSWGISKNPKSQACSSTSFTIYKRSRQYYAPQNKPLLLMSYRRSQTFVLSPKLLEKLLHNLIAATVARKLLISPLIWMRHWNAPRILSQSSTTYCRRRSFSTIRFRTLSLLRYLVANGWGGIHRWKVWWRACIRQSWT